jgi:hypothetical protein
MIKVLFELQSDAPTATETLWARPLSNDLYELRNTPFFARHCALGDIVRCTVAEEELPRFVEVVTPSGNRTVRIFVPNGPQRDAQKAAILDRLDAFRCTYELHADFTGLVAVCIPREVDRSPVFAYLNGLVADGIADWESAHV